MPKDQDKYFTEEELQAMTPEQKLQRVAQIEKDLQLSRDRQKDLVAAEKEMREELEAKKAALLRAIPTVV